jgi:hypothetical protein
MGVGPKEYPQRDGKDTLDVGLEEVENFMDV